MQPLLPWSHDVRSAAGVFSTAIAWSKHKALLQPNHLRRVPVIGPWLARQVHRLSSAHKRPRGTARNNAADAAMRRVSPAWPQWRMDGLCTPHASRQCPSIMSTLSGGDSAVDACILSATPDLSTGIKLHKLTVCGVCELTSMCVVMQARVASTSQPAPQASTSGGGSAKKKNNKKKKRR